MKTVFGLVELTLYVVGILSLSAAVTYAVVKFSPSNLRKSKPAADKS